MSIFRAKTTANEDISINLTTVLYIYWLHQNKEYPGSITGARIICHPRLNPLELCRESAQALSEALRPPRGSSLPPTGWGII